MLVCVELDMHCVDLFSVYYKWMCSYGCYLFTLVSNLPGMRLGNPSVRLPSLRARGHAGLRRWPNNTNNTISC